MKPFTALAPTQNAAASTTPAAMTYPRFCSSLMVDNTAGTSSVYVVPYDTAFGAAGSSGTPIAGGTVQVVGSPASCNAASYYTLTGTASATITPGEGQ